VKEIKTVKNIPKSLKNKIFYLIVINKLNKKGLFGGKALFLLGF
jgi:hypothetical protein